MRCQSEASGPLGRPLPACSSEGGGYGEFAGKRHRYTSDLRIIVPLLASEIAIGLEVTIFDPELDPDGTIARSLVDALVVTFERAGNAAPRGEIVAG